MKCIHCQNQTRLYGDVHYCNRCGTEFKRKPFKYEIQRTKMPSVNTITTGQVVAENYDNFMLIYYSGLMALARY